MKRGRTARLLLSFLLVLILLAGLAPAPAEAYWVWDCFWDFFGESKICTRNIACGLGAGWHISDSITASVSVISDGEDSRVSGSG